MITDPPEDKVLFWPMVVPVIALSVSAVVNTIVGGIGWDFGPDNPSIFALFAFLPIFFFGAVIELGAVPLSVLAMKKMADLRTAKNIIATCAGGMVALVGVAYFGYFAWN